MCELKAGYITIDGIGYRLYSGTDTAVVERCYECADNVTIQPIVHYTYHDSQVDKEITETYRVTTIKSGAFQNCTISSISIPEGIKYINHSAFANCTNLSSIIIPNGVKFIGYNAFANCERLTIISLPNSVEKIEHEAFDNCTSFESIKLPQDLKIIEHELFRNCSNLESVLFPDSLCSIEYNAFKNCVKLKDVTFPETLRCLGKSAFYNCDSLSSVTLPLALDSSGTTVFGNCDNIRYVGLYMTESTPSFLSLFPSTVKSIKEIELLPGSTCCGTPIGGNNHLPFAGLSSLEKITIPYSVKIIPDSAFRNCSNLRSISIGSIATEGVDSNNMPRHISAGNGLNPDEAIYLGNNSFEDDKEVVYITWRNVKEIKARAFKGCTKLAECIIPNTVTTIENEAFANCIGLQKVEIPASVTKVGNEIFKNCTSLSDLTIECNPSVFITSNGSNARHFSQCEQIRSLKFKSYIGNNSMVPPMDALFGSSFESIEELVFLPGSDVIYWSGGVNTLRDDLIKGMPELTDVTIPYGVTELTFGAFKDCESLEYVELPSSLKIIGNRCFMNSGLEAIKIPLHVESIGSRAFSDCIDLGDEDADIITEALEPPVCGAEVFDGVKYDYTLDCPRNSVDKYRTADIWKNFFKNNKVFAHDIENIIVEQTEEPEVTGFEDGVVMSFAEEGNAEAYDINIWESGKEKTDGYSYNLVTGSKDIPLNVSQRNIKKTDNETNGIQFTLYGLLSGTTYNYKISAFDAEHEMISVYSGTFATLGISTDIQDIVRPTTATKLLHNGQILILRGDKTYTLTGQEVK